MSADESVRGADDINGLEYFDGDKVMGYFAHIEEVIRQCPVRLVAASYIKHPWPYRLQHVDGCRPTTFQYSAVRMLDSGYQDGDVSNEDVLQGAIQYNATEVVAKDYVHDQERTTDSIREFVELHDPSEHPPAWIPLQPPYDEHYRVVEPIIERSHIPHQYVLGGLARGERAADRIDELLSFRDVAGPDVKAHGLGWAPNDSLVRVLRQDPWLLDSLDNAGPSHTVRDGDAILDSHWKKRSYQSVSGDFRGAIGGLGEMMMWMQAAQRLSGLTNEFESKALHPDQQVLTQDGFGD